MRAFIQNWREQRGGSTKEQGPDLTSVGRMPEAPPKELTNLYGWPPPTVPVHQKNLELEDLSRDKTLQFRATYPKDQEGKLPVLIWSHGLYGSQDFYEPLVKFWASHGYIVLQPTHSDSLRRGTGLKNPTSDWASRPKDVSFLIDSLRTHSLLSPMADLSRIGMGGHSYGSHTTLLLNGAKTVVGGPFTDQRPKCFVAISPQGEDRLFKSSSWSGLARPTLFISGDNDTGRKGDEATWRLAPYKGAPAGEKYLLWIKDAYHNFGGISGARHSKSGPSNGDHLTLVKSSTLAFWDKYLKNDQTARRLIDDGGYNKLSQGLARWSER
jgi:dienelactone hydrolase